MIFIIILVIIKSINVIEIDVLIYKADQGAFFLTVLIPNFKMHIGFYLGSKKGRDRITKNILLTPIDGSPNGRLRLVAPC